MNYFELFDIPVTLTIDNVKVKSKYDDLMDKYRPEEPENASEEKLSHIEKGYKVFQDTDETIRHVLEVKNLWSDDEIYSLPPQFLLEVRDINEELMELELDEKQEQLINVEQKVNNLMINIYENIAAIVESDEEGALSEETLLQVKDYYYQKKYLDGILERINVIRNIASL